MNSQNSLINLGELSKPVNTLIEKISDAIGVVYEPSRIVRKAKAEAQAQEIMALSENSVRDIQERAVRRFIHEETKNKKTSKISLKMPFH